ncbi:hypothetical protein BJX66DRAFT_314492 [Aspergillus keveii]|uniref:DUF7704 domain-containing protein n=1 Tax=Aspergillus keveii TaxID=714993 RepID=A0ABR4FQQ0_9EURO
MPSQKNIPLFYRIALLWYEPIASGLGAYLVLFQPDKYLNSFIPPSYASRNHTHDILLNQLAAAFVYVSLSQGVLLRYTNDITIWKIVNGCFLGWDFILLYSIWFGLSAQGRLDFAEIRGDDWGVIGATLGVTLIRSALCLGVGFRKEKVRGRGNKLLPCLDQVQEGRQLVCLLERALYGGAGRDWAP